VQHHRAGADFESEAAYNKALVQGLLDRGIEGIAITDHDRWEHGSTLAHACREQGIGVLPGVEVGPQNVHTLCIFEDEEGVEDFLGWWSSEADNTTLAKLLGKADDEQFLAMLAHIDSDRGGLLKAAVGSRAEILQSPHLHAVAANQPIERMPDGGVMENARPGLAIVSANDVCHPDDLASLAATCLIRVDRFDLTGLRWALTDPGSRLRAHGAAAPANRGARAITWEGGYLDGQVCGLSDALTCLVGGRGSGKSTVIESIRLALGTAPATDETRRRQGTLVEHVLREGTRISLLIDTDEGPRVLVRTIGDPDAQWFDVDGRPTSPVALPAVEVYGQHELADLADNQAGRSRLLGRFLANADMAEREVRLSHRELEALNTRLEREEQACDDLAEQTAIIPELEERLEVLRTSGINEAATRFSRADSTRVHFDAASRSLREVDEALDRFREEADMSLALPPPADGPGPTGDALAEVRSSLEDLDGALKALVAQAVQAITVAEGRLEGATRTWNEHRDAAKATYDALLRSLEAPEGPQTFVRIERDLTRLRSLLPGLGAARTRVDEVRRDRERALKAFNSQRERRLEALRLARKRANGVDGAGPEVQVSVEADTNLEPLCQALRDEVGGRLAESLDRLRTWEGRLSIEDIVAWCRAGPPTLAEHLGITSAQAERICAAGEPLFRRVEAVDLPPTTRIKLRVGVDDSGRDVLRELDQGLSTGQRATALLRLLLAEVGSGALVIDQPEDDLDNAFVHDQVVKDLRREKHRRQIILATHNANIPVLGDAELLTVLAPGEPNRGGCGRAAASTGRRFGMKRHGSWKAGGRRCSAASSATASAPTSTHEPVRRPRPDRRRRR